MKQSLLFLLLVGLPFISWAQMKPAVLKEAPATGYDPTNIKAPTALPEIGPVREGQSSPLKDFQALPELESVTPANALLNIHRAEQGQPIFISRKTGNTEYNSIEDALAGFQEALPLRDITDELQVEADWLDGQGYRHVKLFQYHEGLPVYGAELRLHFVADQKVVLNGRSYPSPDLEGLTPHIGKIEVLQQALQTWESATGKSYVEEVPQQLLPIERQQAELVVFYPNYNAPAVLAWHVVLHPTLADRMEYLLDAKTGEELRSFNSICHLHGHTHTHTHGEEVLPPGPETAFATDLLGQNRLINTYETGGNYFMIDASRNEMFSAAQSEFPDDPVGVVWTIDAQNGDFSSSNFNVYHVSSSNNTWNSPVAVSAHYNGGEAYEYFLNTHNRVSINGQGGNIISVINVEDQNGPMDNAFWNGYAMFYGNGNVGFKPLARGLDVAGHEMSHGVIQSTANLEYFGESGALNESYADIFGAMIDRDDWQIGEDVVELSSFPSGALRDMANPNQGGSGLNDPGWQPDHVNEQYTGNLDNGGVHINSGIPNRAYYLFAEDIGKDAAEDIYYHALDNYLVKSSQFIDCRLAVIQSASDLFGSNSAQANAAASAFAAVGIGSGPGNDYQDDLATNPGNQYIVTTDAFDDDLYLYDGNGEALADPLSTIDPLSRPSVTDDGSALVYIATDQTMRVIYFDWGNLTYQEDILQDQPIWRNVAVSRDGARLAALTDDYDNRIWVYDFGFPGIGWKLYDLYNPTYTDGVETGNVIYPDFIEWDFAGEFVLYDAFNVLESDFGSDIEWWDIGFIKVWNNNPGYFAGGQIEKLFSGLPENTSVANPTFAKNSDYIIAFDLIDEFEGLAILYAVNVQTGDQGSIFANSILNVPNYTIGDDAITFNALDDFDNELIGINDLNSDKITPSGGAFIFLDDRLDGVWFADGFRILDAPTLAAISKQPADHAQSKQWRITSCKWKVEEVR